MSFADPSRRHGRPTTSAETPSSSARRRAISAAVGTRGIRLETGRPEHAYRPGERCRRIADRNPDAPRSDVEPDNTHVIIVSLFHDMTFRITLCITVFALGIGLRAQTANGVSAEEEARRITDRIRGLQAESDRLAGEARTLLTDLRKLEAERNVQVQRVRDAQAAIVEIQTAIEVRRSVCWRSKRSASHSSRRWRHSSSTCTNVDVPASPDSY